MYVITVVPLRRGTTLESLTYFCADEIVPGTMVTIPLRNNQVLGLVTDCTEVSAAKAALKAATFSLRKIQLQPDAPRLSDAFVHTARDLSQLYAAPLGSILYNLLAPEIRSGEFPLPHTHHTTHTDTHGIHVLLGSREERYQTYRSLVRETFAHGGSVLITTPTSIEGERLASTLSQGISDRLIQLSSTAPKSVLRKEYAKLDDFCTTKLIIATTSHALIERHDITLVIVEGSRSSYYRDQNRPYIDTRDALRIHATHTGRKLILGDLLVRTEDEAKRRADVYGTIGDAPKRIALPGTLHIINASKRDNDTEPFTLFPKQTLDAIKTIKKQRGHAFLFAARRGLAPIVTCSDCGHIFRSAQSGAPYSLIRIRKNGIEERWFACSASGERVPAEDACPTCGSWRIKERGVGIQNVYDELHTHFPTTPIVLFDHVTARTYKRAQFLHDTFFGTKGAILLGTHMAIPYLTKPVDLSVVVNMDALLATPTWRLEEENLGLLLKLREVTTGDVMVQTRTPDAPVLQYAKHATIEQFYTEELQLRQTFNYPPHVTFIHLTWQGTPEQVKETDAMLAARFKEYDISLYPNPFSPPDNPIRYGLIRMPASTWPHTELRTALQSLPPTVRVVINPDKIV